MRGDDERGTAGKRSDQSGGNEEVRVDDVRLLGCGRSPRERQIAQLPTGPRVEDGETDLVAARDERSLDLRDERPEVGRVWPGVHLGDDEDPHGASLRAAGLAGEHDLGVARPVPESTPGRTVREQRPHLPGEVVKTITK